VPWSKDEYNKKPGRVHTRRVRTFDGAEVLVETRPTLSIICYGVLRSTMGWVAEGFEPVAGSEIDLWCVERGNFVNMT
jgi:hypothetical protein